MKAFAVLAGVTVLWCGCATRNSIDGHTKESRTAPQRPHSSWREEFWAILPALESPDPSERVIATKRGIELARRHPASISSFRRAWQTAHDLEARERISEILRWAFFKYVSASPDAGHEPLCASGSRVTVLWGQVDLLGGGYQTDGVLFDWRRGRWERVPRNGKVEPGGHAALVLLPDEKGILLWAQEEIFRSKGLPYYQAWVFRFGKGWRKLGSCPVKSLDGYNVFSKGRFVVWGNDAAKGKDYMSGAALDLETLEWKRLPAAPISPRERSQLYVTNSHLVVWGGDRVTDTDVVLLADGAIYDFEREHWSKIPKAPIGGREGAVAILCDGDFVVWGGMNEGKELSDGAIFDIRSRQWRRMPRAPIRGRRGAMRANLGSGRIVIWGGYEIESTPTELEMRVLADGAIFSVRLDKWTARIPEAPIGRDIETPALLMGDNLVAVGFDSRRTVSTKPAHDLVSVWSFERGKWSRPIRIPLTARRGWTLAKVSQGAFLWGGMSLSERTHYRDGVVFLVDVLGSSGTWTE